VANRVAIVTGSSSGLGLELSQKLAESDVAVVGVSRRAPQNGDASYHIQGNVADPATVERAFSRAAELGDLVTVISCAGAGVFGDPGAYTREDVDDVLAGNLVGTILFGDRAFAHFKGRGEGTIVNVMSTAAHAARPQETIYTAAKWGARGYTDALRAAAKGSKIRVVGVYPGGMNTPFWANARGMNPDATSFADPGEIATAILQALQARDTSYTTDVLLNRI
jgi:NAD(P)-dependent dehydrogenase (short-subunit alcohol dehydrogenase family)